MTLKGWLVKLKFHPCATQPCADEGSGDMYQSVLTILESDGQKEFHQLSLQQALGSDSFQISILDM